MPIRFNMEENGAYLRIRVAGKLEEQDYAGLRQAFEKHLKEHGELRVLLDMTALEGWKPSGFWEEIKFDAKHMSDIGRMAVLGSKEWHHLLISASNPFTHAETRYFDTGEEAAATKWLRAPN